jgi:UDP-N-acetylglucosamine acyltransferase
VKASVHPTAVVDAGAALGPDVSVGPFCLVGPDVRLGAGTRLHSHVVVTGWSTLGERCQVFPFAVLGEAPQDRKFRDERSELVVGDEVVVREHVTVHCGTAAGNGRTAIGSRTLLMAYTHVAHDCTVGCDVVMTNGATLAGHVTVEDHAVLGGFAAVGQMLRVGESAMLAAGAMVEQDVPPYCTVAGDRARVRTVNVVGLRRRGLDQQRISEIRHAFRHLFRSGRALTDVIRELRDGGSSCAEVEHLVAFIEASRKGVCR